jgi:hypothetical protein
MYCSKKVAYFVGVHYHTTFQILAPRLAPMSFLSRRFAQPQSGHLSLSRRTLILLLNGVPEQQSAALFYEVRTIKNGRRELIMFCS